MYEKHEAIAVIGCSAGRLKVTCNQKRKFCPEAYANTFTARKKNFSAIGNLCNC